MNREYHKWHSPILNREMELLVFGHSGARVLVFPTRANRFFEYEDSGMVNVLSHQLKNGWLQLYCLDSYDAESLYCNWKPPSERIRCHALYENYVINEVIPFSYQKNPGSFLMTHGCSLGAYHAVNIALRNPRLIGKAVGFSGRFDLTLYIDDFKDLFEGYYDQNVYFHTPSHFLPNVSDGQILEDLRQLRLVLTIGKEDPFLRNNREFSHTLRTLGIHHDLHLWEGRAHRFRDWRSMVLHYL